MVLIILDGVTKSVFEQATTPFIDSLRTRGAYYEYCYTSFPTMTHSAHTSINTGSYPENHGSGLAIGDPCAALKRMNDQKRYIAAALKEHGLTTSCVADQTLRGAFSYLSVEYFGHSIPECGSMARWSFSTFRPSFLSVTFYATDNLQHGYGAGNEYAHTALEMVDQEVEKLAETIAEAGVLAQTTFIITSDHGQVDGKVAAAPLVSSIGRIGVDYLPNPGGRTVTLISPADKHLTDWMESGLVRRIFTPTELQIMGHHTSPGHFVACFNDDVMWEPTHNVSIHGGIAETERHVPLILSGAGVNPGVYKEIAEGIDVAPTATALLGGRYLPTYQGRVLSEALQYKSHISQDKVLEWRQKREQWLMGTSLSSDEVSEGLLRAKQQAEQACMQGVLSQYQKLFG